MMSLSQKMVMFGIKNQINLIQRRFLVLWKLKQGFFWASAKFCQTTDPSKEISLNDAFHLIDQNYNSRIKSLKVICASLKIVDYLQPLIQVSLSPSSKDGTGRIQAGKSFQASSHINAIFIACLFIISISLSVYAQLIRLQFAKYASKKVIHAHTNTRTCT